MPDLIRQAHELDHLLSPCRLCPHRCGADRRAGKTGKCRSSDTVRIASWNIHTGEEPPISGTRGSGTIFFSRCALSCVFCQNYPISHLGNGREVSIEELAGIMIELQDRGAHNINFVTPTHVAAQLAAAILIARDKGLRIPIVYNCGGYESVEVLRLLEGFVDIYLPDAKYADEASAVRYSGAPGYPGVNRAALKEMYRQVGHLVVDEDGIARRGLIIRHLVLPGGIAGSREVLEFIAREISPATFLSLMAQYHPAHRSSEYPEIARRITPAEYRKVLLVAEKLGIENGWRQEL